MTPRPPTAILEPTSAISPSVTGPSIPLSLWERVAEGRVRARHLGGLLVPGTLTPTLSQRERGSEAFM